MGESLIKIMFIKHKDIVEVVCNVIYFWGLGIGDWGLGPIPNPQSPIPNPQK